MPLQTLGFDWLASQTVLLVGRPRITRHGSGTPRGRGTFLVAPRSS